MDPSSSAGDYLEKHHVYSLFEHLMQQLIIHKPTDPIDFLITQLQHPSGMAIVSKHYLIHFTSNNYHYQVRKNIIETHQYFSQKYTKSYDTSNYQIYNYTP
jgi:hypothetical protein